MSEKERVTVDFDEESYYLDGEYWESWDNYGEEMADAINKEFNKLTDENEQLKKDYNKLKHRHSLLHDDCIEAECDRDNYHKDVSSLEKENEQLNQTINKIKESIEYLKDKEDVTLADVDGTLNKIDEILNGEKND